MADITIAQICDAIETTLGAAASIETTESYDELSDGVQSADTPLLQVYWENTECADDSGTDRTSFQGGVRVKAFLFHADLLARQRAHIADDMKKVTEVAEEIQDILEGPAQSTKPYLGLDGIKAFRWRAERVQITYAGAPFMGARFMIWIWVF